MTDTEYTEYRARVDQAREAARRALAKIDEAQAILRAQIARMDERN